MESPAPEVPAVMKLLQRLVAETQSHPPPVVRPPVPTELEQKLRSFLAGQRQRQRPLQRQRPVRRDWNDVVCFSCGKSGVTGSPLPVDFPVAPVLLADGPQLGSWQVAVVRVDETPAGDTSGRKCPRAEQNRV